MEKKNIFDKNWREKWKKKEITAEKAIKKIIPGNRVFIDTACSEPQALTSTLINHSESLIDTEIIHFLTIYPEKYFISKSLERLLHKKVKS